MGGVLCLFFGIMQILERTAKRINLMVLIPVEIKFTIVFSFLPQLYLSLPKFTSTWEILVSPSVVI